MRELLWVFFFAILVPEKANLILNWVIKLSIHMKTFEDLTFGLNINLGELHYSFFVINMGALGLYLLHIDHLCDGFTCDTLITSLMVLPVILPCMLIILLSTLNVIGLLIYGNSLSHLLNLNLTFETVCMAVGSDSLILKVQSCKLKNPW